ncbi:MAG: exodeoxyribonuclease VII large subunit [Patescibacteria group bacterium]
MEFDYTELTLTVGQYLDNVNEILKQIPTSITGEVTEFTDRGNTIFFTLSDKNEQAILSCLIWKFKFNKLGITLEEGMEVKITGTANMYKPSGRFSFVADTIVPQGEGALKKAYEQLKLKLTEKGYFDASRKRELPNYIEHVGLITADKSDAKKDFETHLGKYGYKIYFQDVRVEGVNAIDNVVNAITSLNQSTYPIEVIVLTRGGGSLESLQAFNSEAVAKAIYGSKIPVISAIGHENDISISDLVADIRASTPTDAGKIISADWREAQEKLATYQNNFVYFFQNNQIDKAKQATTGLITSVVILGQTVEVYKNKLQYNMLNMFRLSDLWTVKFVKELEANQKLLAANDPLLKLQQGYSITRDLKGNIIRNAKTIKEGEQIETQLGEGMLKSVVS